VAATGEINLDCVNLRTTLLTYRQKFRHNETLNISVGLQGGANIAAVYNLFGGVNKCAFNLCEE